MANKSAVDKVLALLKNVTRNASGWTARCPSHDDNNPSLSVSVAAGRVLIHCFAGCSAQEVIAAIGLKWSDLSLDQAEPLLTNKYSYRDERGNLLFQVLRYEPKNFKMRRPDGQGGWIYNLKGTRRVPYRLDCFIGKPSVIITEGEKDAETARELRLGATTNPGGAGNWRAEYNEHFREKGVYIVPDNDDPGLKHARSVACELFDLAKFVKIVTLPSGKDLTEWHENGGTRGELIKLLKTTPRLTADIIAPWTKSRGAVGITNRAQRNTIFPWPDPPSAEAFRGPIGDLVHTIEPHSEADPVAILGQALIIFGNIVGRKPHFLAEADRHGTNLFAVTVGTTSKGRKGVSLSQAKHPFLQIEGAWISGCMQSGLSSGEGLIWAVRDPIERLEPIKVKGRVEGYQSVVADKGVEDKRLLVVETEFASVLRILSREGSTLSATVRQAWDNGDLRILTKNNPAKSTGAHISIIGHITRDELLRELDSTEVGNGFANRFLWLCVRRSKCLPEGGRLDESELAPITERLRRAIAFANGVQIMKRAPKARLLWNEIYSVLSEGRLGLLGAVTSRAEAQVMRLACNYALLDCSKVIAVQHLRAAMAFWNYCAASAQYIFGDSLGDPVADELLNAIREHPDGLSRTAIRDLFNRNRESSQIDRVLAVLLEHGLARCESQKSDVGRPTERWLAVR